MASSAIPNLWPESFGVYGQPTPVAILREQGMFLGRKTDNLVYGSVRSGRGTGWDELTHTFEIAVPSLGYRQPVLIATHKRSDPYPVTIATPSDPRGPNKFSVGEVERASSSEEFIELLKGHLQSDATTKLIQALIAQCDIGPSDD